MPTSPVRGAPLPTTMRGTTRASTRWLRSTFAAALLGGLVACGSADPSASKATGASSTTGTTSSTTTLSPSTPGTLSPPHDFPAATKVTVVQSGGLKPVTVTHVFVPGQPSPRGFSPADVAAVLKAAADPALKTPPEPPSNSCCDRFVYRVTIRYPDGTSTTFTTVGGAPTSRAVTRLLSLAT
jgi:hypothetical protein